MHGNGIIEPRVLVGDCRDTLPTIEPASVDCCITSPPFFQLRDYGHEGQLGREETVEKYVENLVGVFRLVRPLLKREGTAFLNLGDTYSNKQLLMVPARVALALQADGWILRSEIVWAKGGRPMPESVKDRPSAAHEKIWFLAQSRRHYYGNDAAVMPLRPSSLRKGVRCFSRRGSPRGDAAMTLGRYDRGQWVHDGERWLAGDEARRPVRRVRNYEPAPPLVWSITPSQFKGAHFATFPAELVERCLACGCPEGGVVLDPFAGSGTVGLVASQCGRRSILCELNPEFAALTLERIEAAAGGDDWQGRRELEAAGQGRLL